MDLQVQPESDHTLGCSSEVQKLQSISLLENDGKAREAIYWMAMFLTSGKPFLAHVKSFELAGSQLFPGALDTHRALPGSLEFICISSTYSFRIALLHEFMHDCACVCVCERRFVCLDTHGDVRQH